MIGGGASPLLDSWLAKGPEIGDYLTIRSIKMVADGRWDRVRGHAGTVLR